MKSILIEIYRKFIIYLKNLFVILAFDLSNIQEAKRIKPNDYTLDHMLSLPDVDFVKKLIELSEKSEEYIKNHIIFIKKCLHIEAIKGNRSANINAQISNFGIVLIEPLFMKAKERLIIMGYKNVNYKIGIINRYHTINWSISW